MISKKIILISFFSLILSFNHAQAGKFWELNVEELVTRHASPVTAFLNIGTGEDQTIEEIAALIKSVVGFTGEIHWDSTKPDGTLKKLLDVSKLRALGVTAFLSLEEGISRVYNQYLQQTQ